jgi:hypothetical protein
VKSLKFVGKIAKMGGRLIIAIPEQNRIAGRKLLGKDVIINVKEIDLDLEEE